MIEMCITTDGALSFCMCVCYDAYCYICINFQVHIQQWIDFASFEIDANILAFYRPKIGRAAYLPLTEEVATSLLKRERGAVNTRLASKHFHGWAFHASG